MKVERVSYDVMTPSAARGILEAIHWKPAIRWVIERIDVLNPIKWESVRRNEVGSLMSPRNSSLFIEEHRQQRAGLLLRDVDYVIHACFALTSRAGPDDNVQKHYDMFMRRAEKGKCFHRPYLGCREFAAHFTVIPPDKQTPLPVERLEELGVGQSRQLGFMLHDMIHDNSEDNGSGHVCSDKCQARFFRAVLENGSMIVPPRESREARS
jgi:CRISPR-associated protein Cas5d